MSSMSSVFLIFWIQKPTKNRPKIDKKSKKYTKIAKVEGENCQDESQEAQESHQEGKKRDPDPFRTLKSTAGKQPFGAQGRLGGRGESTKQPQTGYLTRHWAKGPANY